MADFQVARHLNLTSLKQSYVPGIDNTHTILFMINKQYYAHHFQLKNPILWLTRM